MEKKLYRNEYDRTVAGVASGLSDYLEIEKSIVKLLFILSAIFLGGAGIIIYIILWIVTPVNNDPKKKYQEFAKYFNQPTQGTAMFNQAEAVAGQTESSNTNKWNTPQPNTWEDNKSFLKESQSTFRTIMGVVLIMLGLYFGFHQMGILPHWIRFSELYKLWPIIIVAFGISLIFKNRSKKDWKDFQQKNENSPETAPTDIPKTEDKEI